LKFHKKKNERGSGLFAKGTLKLIKTKQSGPQAMASGGEAPGRPNSGEDGSPPARERGGRAKGVCGYLGVVVWRLGVVGGGLFTAASAHRRRVAVGFWWGEKGMARSGDSVEGEEA